MKIPVYQWKALRRVATAVLLAVGTMALSLPVEAQGWGGLYNMDGFLREPHPFAYNPAPAQPAAPVRAPAAQQPYRGPSVNPRPLMVRPATAPAQPVSTEMASADTGWNFSDMFSEIRGGALAHDTGPFSSKEEGGVDANFELLFASPGIFEFMWSPRPHIGVSYNSSGDTSQAYWGLTWEWSFWDGWFAGFSLGGMAHDGHLVGVDDESKSLGCRFLFRESINAGYRFAKRHAIMIHLDHSSNASLCEKNTSDGTANGRHDVVLNEGLENVGIRYGYMF